MLKLFTRHPATVGESYLEHLFAAGGFAVSLLLATVACAVHALLPFLFEQTASARIAALYARMVSNRESKGSDSIDPEEPESIESDPFDSHESRLTAP
ncbi:MAG: DUF6356 family protein [Gammaproteobacteria bacterium]|nr:DUF6356 family protein [Gammaproteobacteria bacterium]